jgi:hypothetical protein
MTEVFKSYSDDLKCQELIQQLTVTSTALPNFTFSKGLLRYKNKIYVGSSTPLRKNIIDSLHNFELGGHSGEKATYERIKLLFHWPGLKQQVVDFIKQCPTCQLNKSEHCKYPGLLQPLPVPDFAWTHISMDFVEGLPLSENKDMILVVVDRFTKYAHFISMKHPITAKTMAKAFSEHIFKLYGLPTVMVTDRDRIFTSALWQDLFKSLGVKLHFSTSYHSQTDGQTERVNQCLENYLRNMAFLQPKKWHHWLALAEWWYNTSFHTSLKMSPFQALYGRAPPMIAKLLIPADDSDHSLLPNSTTEAISLQIKANLQKAQETMKLQADRNRSERHLEIGDMVYLKLQPYRHTSLSIHRCLKLHSKYYGPFRVLEKIGNTSYKLLLPDRCKLHPTFHVSQLKKQLGSKAIPTPHLPLLNPDGTILIAPEAILDRKLIPRVQGSISILVAQWLIKWENLPADQATWEDASFIQKVFFAFHP